MVDGKGKGAVRHKEWRGKVRSRAEKEANLKGHETIDAPVRADVTFYMTKPKSKPDWKVYPDTKPDLDKLIRSIFDSISGKDGPIIREDSRIVEIAAKEFYAGPEGPGVRIVIERLTERE